MKILKPLSIIGAVLIFFAAWFYYSFSVSSRSSVVDQETSQMIGKFDHSKFNQRLKELRDNPQARQDMIDWAEREHICVSASGCK
jgi:hypothetical protein